ncbi:MAG: outer membrane protein transport protein [Myxococcales bacterium]|nr:outer membrane protein transport protein [Myxococcales bacterium]
MPGAPWRGDLAIRFVVTQLIAVLVVALGSRAAWATPVDHLFEEWGVGPRDGAMGNVGVATSNDFAAVYYNPAALTLATGTSLVQGYRVVRPSLWIDFEGRGRFHFKYPDTRLAVFGMTTDLGFLHPERGSFVDRLSVGFAISTGDYLKSFTTFPNPNEPNFFRYSDRFVGLFPFGLGLGFRVTDWFRVGGAAFIAPSDTFTNVVALADISIGADGSVGQNITQGVTTRAFSKIVPVLGFLVKVPFWDLEDKLTFGFTWRDTISSVDGEGVVRNYTTISIGGTRIRLPDPTLIDVRAEAGFSPQAYSVGLGWKPILGMTLGADWIYKRWSKFRNFDEKVPHPKLRNTMQVRLGAEYEFPTDLPVIHTMAVRAGYYFEPSPVRDQSGPTNLLDNDKHVLSAGFALSFFDPFKILVEPLYLNISAQAHLLENRKTRNDGDPLFGPFETGGYLLGGSVTLETKF